MSQSSRPVGGWQEEWAQPTRKLLMIRARGEVDEPGKEEPGGVGGEEEGGDEREGGRDAPEGIFKKKKTFPEKLIVCSFHFFVV